MELRVFLFIQRAIQIIVAAFAVTRGAKAMERSIESAAIIGAIAS